MILYLTLGDNYSGIYKSQVIDVVSFLKSNFDIKIRLIAFISIRVYKSNRKKIKQYLPDAIILPMFPKLTNWKWNSLLLILMCLLFRPVKIIARGPIATFLALFCKKYKLTKTIVLDCRGVVAAEWNEYNVIKNIVMEQKIKMIESYSIINSDFRIAVSNKLVEYWRQEYGFISDEYVVIPCTLNQSFLNVDISTNQIIEARFKMGFTTEQIVLIYSGSTAGWQSFNILSDYIRSVFEKQNNCVLFFLGQENKDIEKLNEQFPDRVKNKYVNPEEVMNYLIGADYGLLIRENSITNQVASPVKFAEYLVCGLNVIISEGLGDYSKFVTEMNCGFIYNKQKILNSISLEEKNINKTLALKFFSKENNIDNYKKVIDFNNI